MTARLAAAFVRAAEEDLAAARRLIADLPRPAAYHLQQVAEKLAKAMLVASGIAPVPRSHDIGYLAARLPTGHRLAAALAGLAMLTEFHIAARYPLGDDLVPAPDPKELRPILAHIEILLLEVGRELSG